MDSSSRDEPSTSYVICPFCPKKFGSIKLLNRHKKRMHNIVAVPKECRIICPMCEGRNELKTHENLRKHLEEKHAVSIELLTLRFLSMQEYESWKQEEKIETSYSVQRTNQSDDHKVLFYICNRSDSKGYQPNYNKRTEKSGGTIKIKGMCPSQLICRLYHNGTISVSFWKTHAGHENELRSLHLSTSEKDIIVQKLKSGVPVDRILEDARKTEAPQLQRINLINRDDITYITRKHNINKKRDPNEMVAVALKVQEWNTKGQNFAFFYKPEGGRLFGVGIIIGETHEVLKKEDFALGFMNTIMEEKLKTFSNIICMDGTHGTNRRGMDLTILLVKDDRNAGFPVAFFITNRLDQVVQEIFLRALTEKLHVKITANFFMSDDDPKYYNAWVKVMENQPQRLLCTWHVVRNWNIQGKRKIKDEVIRKEMKKEMKRIINETNEDRFMELANMYLLKLQEANEMDFVKYLAMYYFSSEDRIRMWAHCYRRNAGINTNMAIESLNNVLKTNQLRRNPTVTIEKLLDGIEELVDIKMWIRITDIERPNANNYQDRIITKAHKKAEEIKNKVKVIVVPEHLGKFQVKSSKDNNLYNIDITQICESNCRTLYCRVCKICIHRYTCDCPEYTVRNTLCKHVHLVRMYEERMGTNSVADNTAKTLGETSIIKPQKQEEIAQFLQEKYSQQVSEELKDQNGMEVRRAQFQNWTDSLSNDSFSEFMDDIQGAIRKRDQAQHKATSKRKMETQEYFPTNKRRKEPMAEKKT